MQATVSRFRRRHPLRSSHPGRRRRAVLRVGRAGGHRSTVPPARAARQHRPRRRAADRCGSCACRSSPCRETDDGPPRGATRRCWATSAVRPSWRGLLRRGLLGGRPSSPPSSWPVRPSWRRSSWRAFLAAFLAAVFFAGFWRPSWQRSSSPAPPSSPARLGTRTRPSSRRRRPLQRASASAASSHPSTTAFSSAPGAELRDRRLLRLDALASTRVAHPPGVADALLEGTEARDGDLLAPSRPRA